MGFKIGDKVTWMSQSGGWHRRKDGEVEAIVPAGQRPVAMSKNRNPGQSRDHESYLVRVKGKGLYWPRAASLRPVDVLETPTAPASTPENGGGHGG